MKSLRKSLSMFGTALLLALGASSVVHADILTTRSGLRVEGTIVSEDDNQIMINTEYGQLRFLKINLNTIQRGSGSSFAPSSTAPSAPSGFGAPTGGTAVDPFGPPAGSAPATGGAVDPFGPPAGSAPASGGAFDPFGPPPGGAPTAGGGGFDDLFGGPMTPPSAGNAPADPFGGFGAPGVGFPDLFGGSSPAAPSTAPSAAPATSVTPTPALFRLVERSAPPVVPLAADAVLYGVAPEAPASHRPNGNVDFTLVTEDLAVSAGGEVETRENRTARLRVRGSGQEVRILDQSHVQFNKIGQSAQSYSVTLQRGSVWCDLRPTGAFSINTLLTTEASISAPGSLVALERIQGATRVIALEGTATVVATHTGITLKLVAGQHVIVNNIGQVFDVETVEPNFATIWSDWNNQVIDRAQLLSIQGLLERVVAENTRWETEMKEITAAGLELRYQETLNRYADAFMRLATDTGVAPESEDGWSLIKFGQHLPGWNGPYVEGPVPPLDPWKQPLIYRQLVSSSGNLYARIYSLWQDGRDQGGESDAVDRIALVMYFRLPKFQAEAAALSGRRN